MNLQEIIDRARERYKAGLTPVRQAYGADLAKDGTFQRVGVGCCGLGAAAIGLEPGEDYDGELLDGPLGITRGQHDSFTTGFDGLEDAGNAPDWYAAGKALAAEVFRKRAEVV